MKINPLQADLKKEELTNALSFLSEKKGIIKSKDIKGLIKRDKAIIFAILDLAKKYNIEHYSFECYNLLLKKMLDSKDITDFAIANYIQNIMENIIDPNDMKKLENLNESIGFFWSVNSGWKPLEISGNIEKILGYSKEDFYSEEVSFKDIIHKDDIEKIENDVNTYTAQKTSNFTQEYRLKRKDGTYILVKDNTICKYTDDGQIKYYYGYIKDITEERKKELKLKETIKKLHHTKFTNSKTGLPNIAQLFLDIEKSDNPFLFLIKIENFGDINTLYGFKEGDKIIQNIVIKLKQELDKLNFCLYNTGSSTNFAIINKNCSGGRDNVNKKIEQIENILSGFSVATNYGEIHISFNGGGVCSNEDIYNKALIALYNSKDNAEKITFLDEELEKDVKEKSKENMLWINRIIDGIKNDKFYPVYQGIRNNKTGEIEKYESLIRFNHDGTEITPFSFLGYAEKMGRITDLTKIMLEKVIADMKSHNKDISINLTESDFALNDIPLLVGEILEKNNILPGRLIIEILEDITIADESLISSVAKLKELGVKIAIDDFGTGYSNFERLMKIQADFIKIDGSLVKEIRGNKEKIQILRLITDLAHIKNAKTIAEFVDNQETQDIIETLGIDYTQGYLYSRPEKRDFSEE